MMNNFSHKKLPYLSRGKNLIIINNDEERKKYIDNNNKNVQINNINNNKKRSICKDNINNNNKKKKRKQRNPLNNKIKEESWEIFVGLEKQTNCIGCGVRKIHRNKNYGYEASHIVAQVYMKKKESPFNILPSCTTCNSECGVDNYFDFLFRKGRITQIKYIAKKIYEAYRERNKEDVIYFCDDTMWMVIDKLYGPKTYFDGGGIQNIKDVYKILKYYQVDLLGTKAKNIMEEVETINKKILKILSK